MKILNPNCICPIEARAKTLGDKIAAAMASNTGKQNYTLEEIKALLTAEEAAEITPGMLDCIAQVMGWTLEQ